MPRKFPTTGDLIYYADQFVHDPVGSKIVKYARDRATDYLINKMPRADPFSRLAKRRRPMDEPPRKPSGPGHYTGKFKFPNKRPKTNKSIYATRGARGKTELNATGVTHNDVSYMGFNSIIKKHDDQASITLNVALAIVRKMFKDAFDIDIESPRQSWSSLGFGQVGDTGMSLPYELHFYLRQTRHAADASTQPYASIQTEEIVSPATIAASTYQFTSTTLTVNALAQHIAQYVLTSRNFGACGEIVDDNVRVKRELYGYQFRYADAFGQTNPAVRFMGIKRLDKFIVKVKSYTTVYVQNVTQSDSASNSTDVIDTNPINGRIYYFKHPNPVVRTYFGQNQIGTGTGNRSYKLMHDLNGDGCIYPSSTNGVPQLDWAQLPTPDMFENLKSYSTVSLEPGEIKRIDFKFTFDGYINNFIQGMKLIDPNGITVGTTATKYQHEIDSLSKAMGTCILFAWEKRLSTGTNQPSLNYQRNTFTEAVVKKVSKATMLPVQVAEATISVDALT